MAGHRLTRAASLLAVGIALGALACSSDATGPDAGVAIHITVTQLEGPDVFDVSAAEQRVECELTLRATASGRGRATWLDGMLVFYAGPDRGTAVDSIVIPRGDVQQAWGSADIEPGQTQEAGWRISASIPFGAALVHRYQPEGGSVRTERVAFNCGPAIPDNLQPPRIQSLTIDPNTEVEPGKGLTVHYLAESDVALWTSGVRLSGACSIEQTFSERLVRSSEHSVTLMIPQSCTIGGALSVSVEATDAALQSRTVTVPQRLPVVDRTPPQVYADRLPAASAYVFVGDTVRPFIAGLDNSLVRSIVWEVQPGGIRDSILGPGGRFVDIPIRAEWSGTRIQFRLFARDAAGLVSDTLVAPPGGLPIYPTISPPVRSTTIAGDIEGIEFDDRRGLLYFMQWQNSARLGVFSLSSLTITETIPLATLAYDMEMTAGGDSLLLVLPYQDALGIIDLRSTTRTVSLLPLRSLDTLTHLVPGSVRVGANGKAYVRLDGPSPGAPGLLEVDLVNQTERFVAGPVNLSGVRFERSFDRSVLLFSQGTDLFLRYDVALGTFSPIRSTQSVYGPLRVDATGSRITLGLDVFDGNLDFLRRVAGIYGGEAIPGSALSRDGNYLYQALGYGGVGRARTSDGTVLDRVRIPFSASGALKLSPDGNTLVVWDSFLNTARIALIDLR